MILDHPLVSQRIFFPRPTDFNPDLVVEVGGGVQLACYVRQGPPRSGIVVHFHGNGELASEYARRYAGLFRGMGVGVCFSEYRGYGRSTGTPALAAMRGDGERVVRALGVDPRQVVAFGRSLGSLYAIELANRLPGLAGVVVESGIANVAEHWAVRNACARLGQSEERLTEEVKSEFDLQQKLGGYRGALLVLHAEHDQFLGRSHAERLHAWGGGTDKRLVVFPSGNHNTILFANLEEYLGEVREFFERVGVAPASSR
jgi:pimeloyl-ACP methyl ester carboxylesterase